MAETVLAETQGDKAGTSSRPETPAIGGAINSRTSTPDPAASPAQQYCSGIIDIAQKTQAKADKEALALLAQGISERLTVLESKIAEHKEWLTKREEFLARARDSMVQIYTRMKAESAAAQVAEMDQVSAAATLARMDPKSAGAILAEIEPTKAARLSNIIAGLADISRADNEKKGSSR